MRIRNIICLIKGHNHKLNHISQWYDFTTEPWMPVFSNIGKCVRCGEMRKMNDENTSKLLASNAPP